MTDKHKENLLENEDMDYLEAMEDEEAFEWATDNEDEYWIEDMPEIKPTKKQKIHECEACGV